MRNDSNIPYNGFEPFASSSGLRIHMNVCLSRLSLKFLRDDSVNVGHIYNTATDFCSSVRELRSSVGVGRFHYYLETKEDCQSSVLVPDISCELTDKILFKNNPA